VVAAFLLGIAGLVITQVLFNKPLLESPHQSSVEVFLILSPAILMAGIFTMRSTAVGNQPLALIEFIMGWMFALGLPNINFLLTIPIFFQLIISAILLYATIHSFVYLAKKD